MTRPGPEARTDLQSVGSRRSSEAAQIELTINLECDVVKMFDIDCNGIIPQTFSPARARQPFNSSGHLCLLPPSASPFRLGTGTKPLACHAARVDVRAHLAGDSRNSL